MSDYQEYVTNDRTTDNSRMRIFGNRTSKLVILFII